MKRSECKIDTPAKSLVTKDQFLPGGYTVPQRYFMAGSEWLYVKIYCGINSAERILKEVIRPLTGKFIKDGTIDKWFFLRYADPEHHVRIRFHHATDKGFWKEVMGSLHAALEEDTHKALTGKIQLDTYEREIERYGAATIGFSGKSMGPGKITTGIPIRIRRR